MKMFSCAKDSYLHYIQVTCFKLFISLSLYFIRILLIVKTNESESDNE